MNVFLSLSGKVNFVSGRVKCYDDLGCFAITPEFKNFKVRPINKLPLPRKFVNTRFRLYTRFILEHLEDPESGPAGPEVKPWADQWDTFSLHFDPTLATKIVVPGILDSEKTAIWLIMLRNALLAHGEYNVIMVNWNNFVGTLPRIAANTHLVGAEIASLVHHLMSAYGIDPESVHIIGHSIGAHAASYAGKRIANLGRITGLDPIRKYFQGLPKEARLSSTDANFVDVIHSNFKHKKKGKIYPLGYQLPVGHVDFFPNSDKRQPGCKWDKKLAYPSAVLVKMMFGKNYKKVFHFHSINLIVMFNSLNIK